MFNFIYKKKKKVYDKWFLLIFSTLVVCAGIVDELFKGTSALNENVEVLSNNFFDDMNFYKCVIDAYNKENNTEYDYTYNLSDDELNTITDLYCNGDSLDDTIKSTNGLEKLISLVVLDVSSNELTTIDVSNNLDLTSLFVSNNQLVELDVGNNLNLSDLLVSGNQLSEIDVSNNLNLIRLDVSSNQLSEIDTNNNLSLNNLLIKENKFNEIIYVYKGSTVVVGNNVVIAEHLNWGKPLWSSSDNVIANVNNDGLVTTLKGGNVVITGVVDDKYITKSKINIVEITSDEYVINEVNNYIVINNDSDVETIKNNINLSHEDVSLNVDLENNKLQVMYNGKVLKEYNLNTDGNDNNDNHFEIQSDYNIDNSNNVISNVQLGITGNSLIDNINTNGTISLLDKNDNVLTLTDILKTGDKVKVSYEGYSVVYKISVTGDATGDGKIANGDVNE